MAKLCEINRRQIIYFMEISLIIYLHNCWYDYIGSDQISDIGIWDFEIYFKIEGHSIISIYFYSKKHTVTSCHYSTYVFMLMLF